MILSADKFLRNLRKKKWVLDEEEDEEKKGSLNLPKNLKDVKHQSLLFYYFSLNSNNFLMGLII